MITSSNLICTLAHRVLYLMAEVGTQRGEGMLAVCIDFRYLLHDCLCVQKSAWAHILSFIPLSSQQADDEPVPQLHCQDTKQGRNCISNDALQSWAVTHHHDLVAHVIQPPSPQRLSEKISVLLDLQRDWYQFSQYVHTLMSAFFSYGSRRETFDILILLEDFYFLLFSRVQE